MYPKNCSTSFNPGMEQALSPLTNDAKPSVFRVARAIFTPTQRRARHGHDRI